MDCTAPSTRRLLRRVIARLPEKYAHEQVSNIDGVKIDFTEEWIHLRKSNTEPIIRIYAEDISKEIALEIIQNLKSIL